MGGQCDWGQAPENPYASIHGLSEVATDPEYNSFNWPAYRKWRIMGVACLVTFIVGLNSTAITTAFPEIASSFGLDDTKFEYAFFTVTSWNVAAAILPLATLPLMDTFGIYYIYLALAPNFATLIVTRSICGALGGTLQNAAEGMAANMFGCYRQRLTAVTLYIFSLIVGVSIGPVQGAIVGGLSWRWIFWIQLIIYGVIGVMLLLFMEETRGPVLKQRFHPEATDDDKALRLQRTASAAMEVKETVSRSVVLLVTEPTVFFFMLWSSFSFGLIFISTESTAQVFGTRFAFQAYQLGLVQASIVIGEILGLIICELSNGYYAKRSDPKRQNSRPELSLYTSIPATILGLSGGLFVYAWTSIAKPSIHWIAPAIGLAMQGCAVQIIITAASIYITDSYEAYAASAVGAVAFGENVFAAFLPLASLPMYTKLGFQWASTLLALVALLLAGAPIALAWKGPWIRQHSKAIKRMQWHGTT